MPNLIVARIGPALAALSMGLLLTASPCLAQTTGTRPPTLEERLTAGLEARRPSELAFVEAVVDTVNRGDLPESLVDRFFNWSRLRAAKRGRGRRAIIYFQAGLQVQADRLRIDIRPDSSSR